MSTTKQIALKLEIAHDDPLLDKLVAHFLLGQNEGEKKERLRCEGLMAQQFAAGKAEGIVTGKLQAATDREEKYKSLKKKIPITFLVFAISIFFTVFLSNYPKLIICCNLLSVLSGMAGYVMLTLVYEKLPLTIFGGIIIGVFLFANQLLTPSQASKPLRKLLGLEDSTFKMRDSIRIRDSVVYHPIDTISHP